MKVSEKYCESCSFLILVVCSAFVFENMVGYQTSVWFVCYLPQWSMLIKKNLLNKDRWQCFHDIRWYQKYIEDLPIVLFSPPQTLLCLTCLLSLSLPVARLEHIGASSSPFIRAPLKVFVFQKLLSSLLKYNLVEHHTQSIRISIDFGISLYVFEETYLQNNYFKGLNNDTRKQTLLL